MPDSIALRVATPADSEALFAVHRDSVQHLCAPAYPPAQLQVWFEGRSAAMYRPAIDAGRIWLAECNGGVLGFVGFVPGEVTLLFVRAQASGSGLGRRLLGLGIEKAQAGFEGPLKVVATRNSQRFYAAHGFVAVADHTIVRGDPALHFAVVEMQRPRPGTATGPAAAQSGAPAVAAQDSERERQ